MTGPVTSDCEGSPLAADLESAFEDRCKRELVDERVIVESAKGHRFEGILERVDFSQRNVLLNDAQEVVAEVKYPAALVTEVDWIVRLDDDPEASE